jgi:hypothetical protein
VATDSGIPSVGWRLLIFQMSLVLRSVLLLLFFLSSVVSSLGYLLASFYCCGVDVSSVTCVSNVSGVPAVAGLPSFVGLPAVASVIAVAELPYCC